MRNSPCPEVLTAYVDKTDTGWEKEVLFYYCTQAKKDSVSCPKSDGKSTEVQWIDVSIGVLLDGEEKY